jgi:hypothetical protein
VFVTVGVGENFGVGVRVGAGVNVGRAVLVGEGIAVGVGAAPQAATIRATSSMLNRTKTVFRLTFAISSQDVL